MKLMRKNNNGAPYALQIRNDREYKRLLEGKYKPELKDTYTESELLEKFRLLEEQKKPELDRREARFRNRSAQIKELKEKQNDD